MQKDFSYPLIVDDLPNNVENTYRLNATGEALRSIAEILMVEDVKKFSAVVHVKFNHRAKKIKVWGEVQAELILKSVISLTLFPKKFNQEFEIKYDLEVNQQDFDGVEFGVDDEIVDYVEDGKIDLAAICVEQIALILDDHPKKEGETFSFNAEFDENERKNPFEVLLKLKK